MLKRLGARERFDILVAQFEPSVRKAFQDAIVDLRDNVEVKRFMDRLEKGDVQGALDALHIDPAAFRPLEAALINTFTGGGVAAIERMPALRDPSGGRVIVRMDIRAPRAEAYARDYTNRLVTRIVEDQMLSLRTGIQAGLMTGQSPNRTALDLIGRVNRATGRREGGVVGLSGPQAEFVASARSELLSGDPTALRNYLGRGRRIKRFDKVVQQAIREGQAIPRDMIERMLTGYSNSLLLLRGEAISRTETMTAIHAGKEEAFRQAIDTGAISEAQVQKQWFAVRDKNSRDHHAAANGERVGLNQRFSTGLLYPHEPGAPASECVNCRCSYEIVIDFLAGIGRDF